MDDRPDPRGWWVMKPCRYWDAGRNARFRFVRIDGPSDHVGRYPALLYDGERRELIRPANSVTGIDLARRATAREIRGLPPPATTRADACQLALPCMETA